MGNTIISAVYGTTSAGIDVTQICQNLVSNGNDDIDVSNTTFGKDPDPGVQKSFAILYSNPALNHGNPIALSCQEGSTLDLVPNPPTATTPVPQPGSPRFKIVHAMYGTPTNGFDVTPICQWLVNNGGTTIAVNNTTFNGDPAPGLQKSFAITYTPVGGGTQRQRACVEGTTLTLT